MVRINFKSETNMFGHKISGLLFKKISYRNKNYIYYLPFFKKILK